MTQTGFQAFKLEWWMIVKISLRAKPGVPKTLVKQKLRLHALYFPKNTLMLTESRGEFSDLHSIFRLRALRYSCRHSPNKIFKIAKLTIYNTNRGDCISAHSNTKLDVWFATQHTFSKVYMVNFENVCKLA